MAYELDFLEKLVTRESYFNISEDFQINFWDNIEVDYVVHPAPGISNKYTLPEYIEDLCRAEIVRILRATREKTLAMKREESIKVYINQLYIFTQGLIIQNNDIYNKIDESEEKDRMICGVIDFQLSELLRGISRDYSLYLNENLVKYADKLNQPDMKWQMDAVDLVEMAVALHESNAIGNPTGKLTRKELYTFFEKVFNHELKDPDSTLSKAKSRKKDQAPFLEKLKKTFIEYCNREL